MGFFDSEIVQQEAKQLFEDYQSLIQLGSHYGKFDREGKKIFIEKMEAMMDRYRIFMKRFELSDDFMAQMTVEQLNTQLGSIWHYPDSNVRPNEPHLRADEIGIRKANITTWMPEFYFFLPPKFLICRLGLACFRLAVGKWNPTLTIWMQQYKNFKTLD
jgi:hypothetical protein